jgi:hypothetical protein
MQCVRALGLVSLVVALVGAGSEVRAQGPTASGEVHRGADAAVALRIGTLGFGIEAGKWLVNHVSARVGVNFGSFSKSGKENSGVAYDIHLKLKAVEALVDLSPSARGNFHFTVGLLTNPVKLTGTGVPNQSGTFDINDHTYTSAQVGTLSAEAKFPSASPYFGIGFGTPARKGGRVKFLFDLGASIGKAKLTLDATGASSNTQLRADLNAQQQKTQADLDKYAKLYPVLSFGLAFHF